MDADRSSDPFRLHYVQANQRCTIGYDTLNAALDGARKRIEKHKSLDLRITDATKRVLLDDFAIRELLARSDPNDPTA
jgi:hypothetical protein